MTAAALAILAAWLAHNAVDWDWQVPVTTVPVLCLAVAAAAGPARERSIRLPGRLVPALIALGLAVPATLIFLSQRDLDAGVSALHRGDCGASLREARAARSVLSVRPEPLVLIAYCDARDHHFDQAATAARAAITSDPSDWQLHYALAVVTAAAGRDPMPQLRIALVQDRLEPLLQGAFAALRGAPRARRMRIARALPLGLF